MTVCIYKDNELHADGRCTSANGTLITDTFKKIGYVYENLDDGTRTVNTPSDMNNYEIFAMYAFAGEVEQLGKFLRWVCVTTHPTVDIEFDDDILEPTVTVDYDCVAIQALLIFSDMDIVRSYSSNYEEHLYVDHSKDQFISIGSGSSAALAIYRHDPSLTTKEIIESVFKISITCGGQIRSISLDTSPTSLEKILDTPKTIKNKLTTWFKK
jgi:hypothetical protein